MPPKQRPAEDDPLGWLRFLKPLLDAQIAYCSVQERYYDGLSFARNYAASEAFGRIFAKMLNTIMDNWLPIVVESVEERMHIDGFRFGDVPAADRDAWNLWQRNRLDAESELLHNACLKLGIAYAMVWPDEVNSDLIRITPESPYEVYVHPVPGRRDLRMAGLKITEDDWGKGEAYVYLPNVTYRLERQTATRFEPVEAIPNPIGKVPVIVFRNRERLPTPLGQVWRSEIHDVLNTQDQINQVLVNMIVAAEFGAYPQRWATGVEFETDPNTGEMVTPWKAAQNRVWAVGDPEGRFGQFEPTALRNYVDALESRIQSLASRTKTPPHYLLGQSQALSGEALKTAETGLVAKVRSRARHVGEAWEDTLRLAFDFQGDPRGSEYSAETIWADMESRTEAEHVDALVKLRSLRVPFRSLWERAGFTQTEIDRFVGMLKDEQTMPRE